MMTRAPTTDRRFSLMKFLTIPGLKNVASLAPGERGLTESAASGARPGARAGRAQPVARDERVRRLCAKAKQPIQQELIERLGIEQLHVKVAAVCVYHTFIETALHALEGCPLVFCPFHAVRLCRQIKEQTADRNEALAYLGRMVALAPDVAAAFPDAESVNDALRVLIKAAKKMTPAA